MTDAAILLGIMAGVLPFIFILMMNSWRKPIAPGEETYRSKSPTEILADLEATAEIHKNYRWVIPKYNQYLGKKYLDRDVTNEMLTSDLFLSRHSLGKWVKR